MIIVRYKVYLDELEEESNELVKYSNEKINPKINELKTLFDDVIWAGKGYNTFINGYNQKIKYLEKAGNNIELLAKYLTNAEKDYREVNGKIVNSWNDFVDEISGDSDGL